MLAGKKIDAIYFSDPTDDRQGELSHRGQLQLHQRRDRLRADADVHLLLRSFPERDPHLRPDLQPGL